MNRWTNKMINDVSERVARGEKDQDIGEVYGVTRRGLCSVRRYHKIERDKTPAMRRLNFDDVARRRAKGESYMVIGAAYGVSDHTARRFCIKYDIKNNVVAKLRARRADLSKSRMR